MADCDVIYEDIARDCNGSIGGIKSVRVINGSEIESITVDEANPCIITAITLAEGSTFAPWKIEKNSSSFTVPQPVTRESGYKGYNPTITVVISKMTDEKNCELMKLDSDTGVFLVRDKNDIWWLLGWDEDPVSRGMEKNDGSEAGTGTAESDLNGYTISLIQYTNRYPYRVSDAAIASLGITAARSSALQAKAIDVPVVAEVEKSTSKTTKKVAEAA